MSTDDLMILVAGSGLFFGAIGWMWLTLILTAVVVTYLVRIHLKEWKEQVE